MVPNNMPERVRGRSKVIRTAEQEELAPADFSRLVFNVRIPQGSIPGDELAFEGPDKETWKATVPEGMKEGQRFQVELQDMRVMKIDVDGAVINFPDSCSIDNPSLCEGSGRSATIERLNKLLESGFGTTLLVTASITSLVLANLPSTKAPWLAFWAWTLGPRIGAHALSLRLWVNEGLMAFFFFTVGLEIKKELTEGSLASFDKAILPCIAAVGGMVMPVLVYVAINLALPGGSLAGATVPMATDIAFAMGIYQAFRRHMPPAASSFLLTLATVDDLGAIAVIALLFAHSVQPSYLAAAAVCLAAAAQYGSQRCESAKGFVIPGFLCWYCLLRGGINADIAGVLIAMCIPMRSKMGAELVERLINGWSALSALVILPLFGLANTAVPLSVSGSQHLSQLVVPMGILLGLIVGKPLGIFSASYLAVKSGISSMPRGMTKRHLAIVGMLGAIGFTMCIFLVENSLTGFSAQMSKIAIFLGSGIGAGISACLMARQPKRMSVSKEELVAIA
eukprot:TRINITY_DN27753_c0_g1_i1.p1 TRINITY_DN27753_c0_g1~~TRINITY_DN27753_c0_g1_i1.p1  ORF type:complete len:586 (-),score=92.38 TRINITY_DN27753_c0_g1_i1:281-1807(-)